LAKPESDPVSDLFCGAMTQPFAAMQKRTGVLAFIPYEQEGCRFVDRAAEPGLVFAPQKDWAA
jgi:hypothetical protein